ncbi:hypothetical protein BaRGS_00035773 [Batillaria attramentaria]|uniref:Uncharacterized protein n=1 Tax=Batillaria attramentaria TaxID=370345 RepID=A0ABD0JDP6_9CAEN
MEGIQLQLHKLHSRERYSQRGYRRWGKRHETPLVWRHNRLAPASGPSHCGSSLTKTQSQTRNRTLSYRKETVMLSHSLNPMSDSIRLVRWLLCIIWRTSSLVLLTQLYMELVDRTNSDEHVLLVRALRMPHPIESRPECLDYAEALCITPCFKLYHTQEDYTKKKKYHT